MLYLVKVGGRFVVKETTMILSNSILNVRQLSLLAKSQKIMGQSFLYMVEMVKSVSGIVTDKIHVQV